MGVVCIEGESVTLVIYLKLEFTHVNVKHLLLTASTDNTLVHYDLMMLPKRLTCSSLLDSIANWPELWVQLIQTSSKQTLHFLKCAKYERPLNIIAL